MSLVLGNAALDIASVVQLEKCVYESDDVLTSVSTVFTLGHSTRPRLAIVLSSLKRRKVW